MFALFFPKDLKHNRHQGEWGGEVINYHDDDDNNDDDGDDDDDNNDDDAKFTQV